MHIFTGIGWGTDEAFPVRWYKDCTGSVLLSTISWTGLGGETLFFMRIRYPLFAFISLLLILSGLPGCASVSLFSPAAYEQATSLKVESLILMDKAEEPFERHRSDVDALRIMIEKAYEYAKGRPGNEITARQWELLKDPDRNLLGGFMKRWQERSTLPGAFISEANGVISDAFDTIIGLESGKINPSGVQ